MTFSGPLTGKLEIIAGTGLCRLLAANMLGIESLDEESQKKASDALKETLNTICGRFLTALAGEKPVFSLTTPEITEIDTINWGEIKDNDNTLFFRIDEYPVLMLADYKETSCK
jgi:chemotaxis protein CheY-P-specific phosphatase CheC